VFSVALLPLLSYLRRPRGARLAGQSARLASRHPVTMLAAPAVPVMVTEAVFGPDVNTGGWERLAYVFPFLYGFLIAGDPRFEAALRRARWPALATALLATGALWPGRLPSTRQGPTSPSARCQAGARCRAWPAARGSWRSPGSRPPSPPTGGAYQAWRVPGPPRQGPGRGGGAPPSTATRPVLPFYLLYEPVIVAAAWVIVRWHARP
jgi:hypothetical protein